MLLRFGEAIALHTKIVFANNAIYCVNSASERRVFCLVVSAILFIVLGFGSVVEVFNIWLWGGVFLDFIVNGGCFTDFIIVEKKATRACMVFFMCCSVADSVFRSGSHPVDSLESLL